MVARIRNREWMLRVGLFLAVIGTAALYAVLCDMSSTEEWPRQRNTQDAAVMETGVGRKLLNSTDDDAFPKKLPAGQEWQCVIWVLVVLYMFLALAIVCDEYFVPALEVMCDEDHLDLGDDVAGATLMAAGGSAPELFTSLIGTFQNSAVGFGTVVGSAVFNVLFVIAMCVFATPMVLELTWWPLARDMSFYAVALTILSIFFGVHTAGVIDWWESVCLLGFYVCYVILMFYNERLQGMVMTRLLGAEAWAKKKNLTELQQGTGHMRSTFRVGVLHVLTSGRDLEACAAIHAVAQVKGDVHATFKKIDNDGDGDQDTRTSIAFRRDGAHHPIHG